MSRMAAILQISIMNFYPCVNKFEKILRIDLCYYFLELRITNGVTPIFGFSLRIAELLTFVVTQADGRVSNPNGSN